jgi:hypothetical protein
MVSKDTDKKCRSHWQVFLWYDHCCEHSCYLWFKPTSTDIVRFQVLTAASMMFRVVFWDLHGSISQKTTLNIIHRHWLNMVGWDYVSEPRPPPVVLFIAQVIRERGQPWWWWWWCRLGIIPDSSTIALWQSYQQKHLLQVGGMDEGVRISWMDMMMMMKYLRYLKESLTCRKILWHGTCNFTSHSKQSFLRILIALKSSAPRQGLNSRPLDPAASTQTTTPPRQSVE